jgi:2-oxoglutarate ferredoxin oxidoreductase subunit delta
MYPSELGAMGRSIKREASMTEPYISDATDSSVSASQPTGQKRKQPKGRVIVYGKWCKECGICIAFCPRNVLAKAPDGSVLVANPDDCTACLWCELHCPDFAITVKRLDE